MEQSAVNVTIMCAQRCMCPHYIVNLARGFRHPKTQPRRCKISCLVNNFSGRFSKAGESHKDVSQGLSHCSWEAERAKDIMKRMRWGRPIPSNTPQKNSSVVLLLAPVIGASG